MLRTGTFAYEGRGGGEERREEEEEDDNIRGRGVINQDCIYAKGRTRKSKREKVKELSVGRPCPKARS